MKDAGAGEQVTTVMLPERVDSATSSSVQAMLVARCGRGHGSSSTVAQSPI